MLLLAEPDQVQAWRRASFSALASHYSDDIWVQVGSKALDVVATFSTQGNQVVEISYAKISAHLMPGRIMHAVVFAH